MDRETAKKLLDAALSLDEGIGRIDLIVSSLTDDGLRRDQAMKLSNVMLSINENFIRPLSRLYPELDPDLPTE